MGEPVNITVPAGATLILGMDAVIGSLTVHKGGVVMQAAPGVNITIDRFAHFDDGTPAPVISAVPAVASPEDRAVIMELDGATMVPVAQDYDGTYKPLGQLGPAPMAPGVVTDGLTGMPVGKVRFDEAIYPAVSAEIAEGHPDRDKFLPPAEPTIVKRAVTVINEHSGQPVPAVCLRCGCRTKHLVMRGIDRDKPVCAPCAIKIDDAAGGDVR